MIHADSVSFYWPQQTSPTLQNITFTLPKGSLLCICGSNGAGKSTLLQILSGLQQINKGNLYIENVCYTTGTSLLLKKTALLLQDVDMQLLGATVKENMLLPWPSPTIHIIQKAYALATRFALNHHWLSYVHLLSHGQKQKLNIASALMMEPDILLLDEPYAGLDFFAITHLRHILQQVGEQKLIRIISVHDLEPIIDISDYLLVLSKGKQVFFGSPNDALVAIEKHPEWGIRLPCNWKLHNTIVPWE